MKKSKEYKMTPEQIIAAKIGKRDELKAKLDRSLEYIALQQVYAENTRAEYEKRDRQVEAMQKRLEEGLKAHEEAEQLRPIHFAAIDDNDVEYLKSEEHLARKKRLKELDDLYNNTMPEIARINNNGLE